MLDKMVSYLKSDTIIDLNINYVNSNSILEKQIMCM